MGQLAPTNFDMDRILDWFHDHDDAVRGDPDRLIARAELAVREHADDDAWREARDYIEAKMHQWERGWGFHASDAYVALEVCPQLARQLRAHERHVQQGDEEHLVGRRLLAMFDPRGREVLREWALEVGEREHHRAWEEVVRYTRRRGRELVRSGRMPRNMDWESNENFAAKAATVASILAEEFDVRSHAAKRGPPR